MVLKQLFELNQRSLLESALDSWLLGYLTHAFPYGLLTAMLLLFHSG